MRRIFLSLLIWLLLVGGLYEYMRRRDASSIERPSGAPLAAAAGTYTLELTPSFDPKPDPFTLNSAANPPPALFARLRGRDLLIRTGDGDVKAGIPLFAENIPGVSEGENEIALAASPPLDATTIRHFLQARILQNGLPIASETFWADGSARVDGVLRFTVPGQSARDEEAYHGK